MKLIPMGSSREEVYIRRAIIVEELSPLIGTSVPMVCILLRYTNLELL